MYCKTCGAENSPNSLYCIKCGALLSQQTPTYAGGDSNQLLAKVYALLKDRSFFTVCVLCSVSAGISLISGGLDILRILLTIFLWILYNDAKSGKVNGVQLKNISGASFASYIINFFAAAFSILGALLILIASFNSELIPTSVRFELGNYYIPARFIKSGSFFFMALVAVLVVTGCFMLYVNITAHRKIHRLLKSTYTALGNGTPLYVDLTNSRKWFNLYAVLYFVSAASNLLTLSLLAAGAAACFGVAMLLAGRLVDTHIKGGSTLL